MLFFSPAGLYFLGCLLFPSALTTSCLMKHHSMQLHTMAETIHLTKSPCTMHGVEQPWHGSYLFISCPVTLVSV